MTHLDLFSGIGGFAYAADQVWDNVEHIFCEIDPFCQQVLRKHWPESEIYDDIRSITSDSDISRYLYGESQEQSAKRPHQAQRKSEPSVRPSSIQLLTGGFPCQPFSAAGLRRGTADERHLWPEMLRVIRLTRPTWVIAENVRGIINIHNGLVFEQVCTDLEAEGYEVQPFIIPAVAVNAPHRRDRVWFVAHTVNDRQGRTKQGGDGAQGSIPQEHRPQDSSPRQSKRTDSDRKPDGYVTNPNIRQSRPATSTESIQKRQSECSADSGVGDTDSGRADWSRNWLEVATELCSVDDGLPVELDGFELSKSKNRAEQLKAYGNAIVPQVAVEIMRGMA